MSRTLAIIKPHSVREGVQDEIISMIRKDGFQIIAEKKEVIKKKLLEQHYSHHKDKPFFPGLIKEMSSSKAILMVLEKKNAVEELRKLCGATNPSDAKKGTIRNKYGRSVGDNAIHASDSDENAEIEINRFFSEEDLGE